MNTFFRRVAGIALAGFFFQAPALALADEWRTRVEIDPAGITTENAFLELLKQKNVRVGEYTDYFTGRWPYISFVGGMAMGNKSEELEFFYEKPFKWWNHILDYVMEGGGKKFGVRATVHRYKEQPSPKRMRSFLLTLRTDTLLKEYHPSYICVNGRKIWDAKLHPLQDGKLLAVFSLEAGIDPVIDTVADLDYTPEIKGLAFRMFFLQYLGDPGVKVDMKGADETPAGSPADKLEKFAFGVFPSGYDFWTEKGPTFAEIKKNWKPNFRPDYPVDDVYLAPALFDSPAKGRFHEFMLTYGGCNVACNNPDPALIKTGSSRIRAALSSMKDPPDAKALFELSPNLEVHWYHEGTAPGSAAVDAAKQATGHPRRVKAIWEVFPPSLPAFRDYEKGNDLLVFKNEEDPQYNLIMSMARGAGRSYGKPFGFYWEQTHYPYPSMDEKLHCCLLYYLAGGSHIGAEADNAPAFEKQVVADWVYPYVQALRFAMVHPARGTPLVPIGVLFTQGDNWVVPYNNFGMMDTFQRHVEYDHATKTFFCEPSIIHPYPWMPTDRSKWGWTTTGHLTQQGINEIPETKGYDLLDVFLPEYGDAYTARITRLLTGTPCGPLDFVYGDKASTDYLKSFGLIAVLGHTQIRGDVEKKVTAAVESGASLLLGAQHLKGAKAFGGLEIMSAADTEGNVAGSLEIFKGVTAKFSGKVHAFKGEGWETVASIGNKPMIIARAFGKGRVYVYLGERIGEGGLGLRRMLSYLGERAAPLKFSNPNDYLEYVAYRKGAGAWLALFNHGNIVIGCDRLKELRATPPEPLCSTPQGPYKGQIEFRLEKLGLDPKEEFALYEAEGIDGKAFDGVISGQKTFSVKPVDSEQKDGVIRASVEIDKRAEYVIAPKGQGEAVFLGKP